MNRTLRILVLSLAFLLCAFPVSAENIFDLNSLTTEELVALQKAVNAELAVRNFAEKEVVVPPGTYTIGEDIPAADYSFRCDDIMSSIYITDANGVPITLHALSAGQTVGKQPLSDGQVIQISGSAVVFAPYRGLGF